MFEPAGLGHRRQLIAPMSTRQRIAGAISGGDCNASASLSDGVNQPRVCRGLPLSWWAARSRSAWVSGCPIPPRFAAALPMPSETLPWQAKAPLSTRENRIEAPTSASSSGATQPTSRLSTKQI